MSFSLFLGPDIRLPDFSGAKLRFPIHLLVFQVEYKMAVSFHIGILPIARLRILSVGSPGGRTCFAESGLQIHSHFS